MYIFITGMQLTTLDVTGCPITGDISCLKNMSATLSELRLSRTALTGDITSFAGFKFLNILELARLPKVYHQTYFLFLLDMFMKNVAVDLSI
jgi:hypothetical protein